MIPVPPTTPPTPLQTPSNESPQPSPLARPGTSPGTSPSTSTLTVTAASPTTFAAWKGSSGRRVATRWQRLLPRFVAIFAVGLFVSVMALRAFRNDSSADRSSAITDVADLARPQPLVPPTAAFDSRRSDAEDLDRSNAAIGNDTTPPAATDSSETTRATTDATTTPMSAPTYRSRMIGALGALVDQQSEVFGESDSGLRRELDGGLAIADDILADARLSNRQSIRDANRQVRLVDRSPALLIILVPGLTRDLLGCYRESSDSIGQSPAIDQFARQGMRSDGFALAQEKPETRSNKRPERLVPESSPPSSSSPLSSPPTSSSPSLSSAASSPTASSSPASLPIGNAAMVERLPRLLWESGYSTRLIGATVTTSETAESWWDSRVGWSAKMTNDRTFGWPFPASIAADGRTIRIANNSPRPMTIDGSRSADTGDSPSPRSFAAVILDEVVSATQTASPGTARLARPLAIVVRTPLDWWRTLVAGQSSSTTIGSSSQGPRAGEEMAVRELDRFVEQLVAGFRPRRATSTLVLFVGLPSDPAELGPLLVHWPGKVPAELRTVALRGESQLLAAIADLIQSTRRNAVGRAHSPWTK